jgi:hypothetical protein
MLIDEADNLELSAQAALRAILNAGYYSGCYIRRVGWQARQTLFSLRLRWRRSAP